MSAAESFIFINNISLHVLNMQMFSSSITIVPQTLISYRLLVTNLRFKLSCYFYFQRLLLEMYVPWKYETSK